MIHTSTVKRPESDFGESQTTLPSSILPSLYILPPLLHPLRHYSAPLPAPNEKSVLSSLSPGSDLDS